MESAVKHTLTRLLGSLGLKGKKNWNHHYELVSQRRLFYVCFEGIMYLAEEFPHIFSDVFNKRKLFGKTW